MGLGTGAFHQGWGAGGRRESTRDDCCWGLFLEIAAKKTKLESEDNFCGWGVDSQSDRLLAEGDLCGTC